MSATTRVGVRGEQVRRRATHGKITMKITFFAQSLTAFSAREPEDPTTRHTILTKSRAPHARHNMLYMCM